MIDQSSGGGNKRRWADLFSTNRLFSNANALQLLDVAEDRVTLEEMDVDTITVAMGECLVG